MPVLDFCTEPAGYSERAFGGTVLPQCTAYSSEDDIVGFHSLCPSSCRVNYYWPRASNGAPSYARIDLNRSSQPDFSFSIEGSWNLGNFSWGIASIGLGSPGAGTSFLVGPCMYVQVTGDDDILPDNAPKFRGVFVNAAGSTFATGWQALTPYSNVSDLTSVNTTIRQYISGTTGYVVLADGSTVSVALSGSFSGPYSRWESWHDGGGGGSSNEGGTGEGRQTASGAITSLRVLTGGPTTGFIGFGTF
jgi:hypothetical protein